MRFIQLFDSTDSFVKTIFSVYCQTFPENERRSKTQFENLFKQEKVSIFSILNNSDFIGYFIIWELDGFAFLEHFEIFEEFRNQNYGSKVLKKITENYSEIILETEPKNLSKIAGKRIHFYERNDFHEISNSYVQPSYGEGKTSLELLLFANFLAENLEKIIVNIYKSCQPILGKHTLQIIISVRRNTQIPFPPN